MGDRTWAAANVPTMWISAQAADTQMAWEQVGAWARTHELLLHHELRLRALQGELSAVWPPERSPAATAFVEHMNGLLIRVAQARSDAAKNRDALKLLLESLASAKKDIAPLKAKWDKFEAEDANRSQNLTNPMPHSGGLTWQQDLNAEARTRMTRSDREVFEATQSMVVLSTWTDSRTDPETFSRFPSTESVGKDEQGFHSQYEPSGSGELTGSMAPQLGPQLAGAATINPASSSSVPSTGALSPNGVDSTFGRSPQALAAVPAIPPSMGTIGPSIGGPGLRSLGAGMGYRSSSSPSTGAAAVPLGVGGQRAGMRVSPVGGVISPGSTGITGVPPMRSVGAPRAEEGARVPLPTLQWEVARGGAPVIEPPADPPFELGPGVIGIDR